MMGISAFALKTRFLEMTKEVNRAQAKDCKDEHESENAGDRLHALLSGEDIDQSASLTELAPKLCQWIPMIRDGFAPYVIRRTLDSVDHSRSKIFSLPPYEEYVMLLELCDWEKARLTDITSELIDQGPITTLAGAGKASIYVIYHSSLVPHTVGVLNALLRHATILHVMCICIFPHASRVSPTPLHATLLLPT